MKYGNGKLGGRIIETIRKQRTFFVCICAMVVFVTTYLLILPAITLDQDTAKDQGGIDLPKVEQVQSEDQAHDAEGLTYEGKGYTVEASYDAKAGLPEDTSLEAVEIRSDDKDYDAWCDEALKAVQEAKGGERVADLKFAKFYDISLISDGQAIEPEAPVDISISYDKALKAADADHVRIIHFGADKKGNLVPEVLDPKDVELDLKKGKMSSTAFAAESFSVYGVVYTVDFHYELDGETFDYSITGGGVISLQMLAEALGVVEDSEDFAVEVENVEFSDPSLIWVGKTDKDTTVGELKKENKLKIEYSGELTEEQIEEIDAQTVAAGDWALISLQPFDTEESLTVTMKSGDVFTIMVTDARDPLGIDDRTVAFVKTTSGTQGYSVQSAVNNRDLAGRQVNYSKSGNVEYCDKEASVWLFEYDPDQEAYYITNGYHTDGSTRYLTMHNDEVNGRITLESSKDNATPVKIERNEDGTYRLYIQNGETKHYLTYNATYHTFYSHQTNSPDSNCDIHFCMPEASGNDASHKATLISAVDTQPGQKLVIYQRVWGTDASGTQVAYYYAIDGNGNLIQVKNSSDSIYWRGEKAIEWTLTDVGNGYYTLYNEATGKYLVPKSDGIVFSGSEAAFNGEDKHLRISLPGRDINETYTSQIASWDYNANVTYGLKTTGTSGTPTIAPAEYLQAQEFYFATRDPIVQGELTEVDTVDSRSKGITIQMYDFKEHKNNGSSNYGHDQRLAFMTNVLTDDEWMPYELHQGLTKRVLDGNGYPVSSQSNKSLKDIFEAGSDYVTNPVNANHLFIDSVYNETGFYKYSCFENFAQLNSNGDFTVYEQLGTPYGVNGGSTSRWSKTNQFGQTYYFPENQYNYNMGQSEYEGNHTYYQRGNFMPYNKLVTNNGVRENRYDPDLIELDDNDPRKKEDLYTIQNGNGNADYFFGMIMSAKFLQNPDGISDHGDPMVYEFNGDDDLWVYVDNVLLLDMGGVHDAFRGKIDFNTGDIYVNGNVYDITDGSKKTNPTTTIKEQFRKAGQFPDGTPWDDNKVDEYFTGNTFKDFSTHDFKMFYMERGAGASNLEVQFNLPVLTESQFRVKKEMPETQTGQAIQKQYEDTSFYYEAYVQDTVNGQFSKVTRQYLQNKGLGTPTYDDKDKTPVVWMSDDLDETIFEVKPGSTAIFPAVDDSVKWYVVEVEPETDSTMLSNFVVTNSDQDPAVANGTKSKEETIKKRNIVIYQNKPEDSLVNELRIKKRINGRPYEDNDAFEYRILLESTDGNLVPYYMGEYYQIDAQGRYIYFDQGQRILQSEDPNGPYTYKVNGETVTSQTPRYAEHTSANGSLGNVLDGDTIIVKGLLTGTDFYVYERTDFDFMAKDGNPVTDKYVFEGTEVTDAYVRGGSEPVPDNLPGLLFDEPGGLGDAENGLIKQYNISSWEQQHAAAGAILRDKDAKVLVKNMPDREFEIEVQKNWPADSDNFSMNDLTDDSKVTFTIQRYKLDTKHGSVKLTGALVNAPSTADPVYTFTQGGKLIKTVKYSDLDDNGTITITDLPIGEYAVSCYDHVAGYQMNSTVSPETVTVSENGEATVSVTSTYTQEAGSLIIRKTLTGDYSADNGTLTYTITGSNNYNHTETLNIRDIQNGMASIQITDLPLGTYTVTETASDSSGTHSPASRTVQVKKSEPAYADFNGNYARPEIPVRIHCGHSPNNGSGWTEDSMKEYSLPAGSTISVSFTLKNCQYYDGEYPYGTTTDCSMGQLTAYNSNSSGTEVKSASFDIPANATSYDIYIKSKCDNGSWAPTIDSNPTVVSTRNTRSLKSMLKGLLRGDVDGGETDAQTDGGAETTDTEGNVYTNSVTADTLPLLSADVAAKKAFVIDDEWNMTVELTKNGYTAKVGNEIAASGDITPGSNFWKALLSHSSIISEDEDGDQYYYYISQVSEDQVPKGMTPSFDMDPDDDSKTLMSSVGDSHTLSVTNELVMGCLKLHKVVLFDEHDPTNANVPGTSPAQTQRQILAGDYTFKIFSNEGLTDLVKTVTITIREDGEAKDSDLITLPVGTYWIEEVAVEGKPIYPMEDNPRIVEVSEGTTVDQPVVITNDYYENSDVDTKTIDIEKRFEGLTEEDIPSGFQIVLQYTLGGETKEIILHKDLRGIQQDNILATFEKDSTGTKWVWHLMGIPQDATGFQIKEENYGKTGYDSSTFRLNRTENSTTEDPITNPGDYMPVNMTGPNSAGLTKVTTAERYTSDNNTSFWIDEGTVLLVALTGNAGTAAISLTSLNNIEREAVKNSIPLPQGPFAQPVAFYSLEQHPTSISPANGRRITVGEVDGRKYVTMKKSGSSQEAVYAVTYYGQTTFNNEIIINKYEQNVGLDLIKVDEASLDKETKDPLKDAVFQMTQLDESSTSANIIEKTKTEGGQQVPAYQVPSDPTGTDGKTSFASIPSGYYKIAETESPAGYILLSDEIYIHVSQGNVTLLRRPAEDTDPAVQIKNWQTTTSIGNLRFQTASGTASALLTVGNEPGQALPNSGGPGTTWIYLIGSILLIGCSTLLVARRRTRRVS